VLAGIKPFLLYWIAGASLFAAWWLPELVRSYETLEVLRNVGWGIWAAAVGLIWASLLSPRNRGTAHQSVDAPCACIPMGGGIYAVIRHPRYLGWLLVYVAVMMLTQHWAAVACALPGMVCIYLISRQEDLRLAKELGPAYEQYMRCVPALNPVTGLLRLLRRKAQDPPAGDTGPSEHLSQENRT
jgi:protein-S-isoprenylcysteine O-methyltransferase Ste14